MKKSGCIKKAFHLSLLGVLVVLASPVFLGKLNFYGSSHAAPAAATADTPISSLSLNAPVSYADAVALAAPAVVSIQTTQEVPAARNPMLQDPLFRYFFGDQNPDYNNNDNKGKPGNAPPKETLQGLGSGVIVNDKGYILTNNHVVLGADTVTVTLADGRISDAKVIGTDQDTDLAVLKINLDKIPVIQMGSSHQMRVGDVVLAIGNPFGLNKTVTQGIVSATERTGTEIGILENLIQTDAAINPGNSGGALIDSFGRLIAINTAIYTRSGGNQGIGFAIPIDIATDIMNKLIEGKPIVRGYLGIMTQALTKETRDYINYKEGDGVYVRAVVHGSPAQKAGLLPGDVIIKINSTPVKDERAVLQLVASLAPGKSYPVDIYRKGQFISYAIMLGERNKSSQATQPLGNEEQR